MGLVALLCAAVFALPPVAASGAGSAAQVAKDPNSIGCPNAPSGWGAPAVSKIVATPQSVPDVREGLDGEFNAQGGNAVTVSCIYHNTSTKTVYVTVSFALPSDMNPVSDFDLGCGNGAVPWDNSNRVYRLSSPEQWALATLIDATGQLPASQVPAFEGVTHALLENAKGYGHPCSLVTKPTTVSGKVYFDILVAGANIKDTFYTSSPNKSGVRRITQISPLTDTFQVQTSAGTHALTIQLTKGIDYRVQTGTAAGQVRFGVVVTGSHVPSCKKGATGTLTISTKPLVSLDVCGQSFLRGPAPRVSFNN